MNVHVSRLQLTVRPEDLSNQLGVLQEFVGIRPQRRPGLIYLPFYQAFSDTPGGLHLAMGSAVQRQPRLILELELDQCGRYFGWNSPEARVEVFVYRELGRADIIFTHDGDGPSFCAQYLRQQGAHDASYVAPCGD